MPGRVFRRSTLPDPPVAVEAFGSTIIDRDGRRYLDAAGGAIVVNVGHGRREIAAVMAAQAARLAYAHGSAFTTEPLEAYARAVGAILPVDDPAIYPVSGGSEAIETALKLARAYHLARGEPEREVDPGAAGQLPRQYARRPGPVGPTAAAPPVRIVARPDHPRRRRLPVSRRGPAAGPWTTVDALVADLEAAIEAAGPRTGGGLRRRAHRGRDAGGRGPARRLLAGDGRGLPASRRAVHRRRGDDRLRADRPLVRARSLGRPAGPAGGRQGRDVGLLAVRLRGRRGPRSSRRSPRRGPASSTASPTATPRSGRRSPARSCASCTTRTWSLPARTRAIVCRRSCASAWATTRPSARSGAGACWSASSWSPSERPAGPIRAPRASPRPSSPPPARAGVLVYSGTGNADGTLGDTILLGPPFVITEDELRAGWPMS